MKKKKDLFAILPSIDEVLNDERIIELCGILPRSIVLDSIRSSVDKYRSQIIKLDEDKLDGFELSQEMIIIDSINLANKSYELSIKGVINATGIVVHTNLGRSLLSEAVRDELWSVASRYSNLEYDIEKGKRGSRYDHLTNMIKRLTGAEDVLVVNNNAAAVMLVLSTMAKGGEAIVSRGELVEVGGSFRIPSIMALSGADLVEVGSTNKTHLDDYKGAITENTKVLMKVHTSNYRIMGFTESVSLEDMRKLGDEYDSINKGVDVVSFSGDKMLGGPQAGIIVGKKKYIEKMKKNQLTRALRVDKMTIATLEASLRLYLDEERAIREIPTLRMLSYTADELKEKAERLCETIKNRLVGVSGLDLWVEPCKGQVGGGSMPTEELDSYSVAIRSKNMGVARIEEGLRLSKSHIIARVYDDKYILDVRTIFEDQFKNIADELLSLMGGN